MNMWARLFTTRWEPSHFSIHPNLSRVTPRATVPAQGSRRWLGVQVSGSLWHNTLGSLCPWARVQKWGWPVTQWAMLCSRAATGPQKTRNGPKISQV